MVQHRLFLIILIIQVGIVLLQVAYCQDDHYHKSADSTSARMAYEPSWVFKCRQDVGCERLSQAELQPNITQVAQKVGRSNLYDSLNMCRTICGRFGGIWPKPTTAALSTQMVVIHPNNIRFDLLDTPAETREILAKMTKVITENLQAECGRDAIEPVDTLVTIFLSVKSPNTQLTWETEEDYTLDVQTKLNNVAVHVAAETVYGARHALETFTHLVAAKKHEKGCGLFLISGAKIKDKPAYRHRGLLLDTSRNFIPLSNIKKTIDGMAATKLNVFHWHVTDSHSFPLESARVPQFTRYGAYSGDEIYSMEEVRELIEYAKIRGVRVVIEIDAPAHAGNGWQWGKEQGLGDLAVCVNAQPWRTLCVQPPCGQLNPANPNMYEVLGNLYRDIADLFTDPPLLHMGGDEVFLGCWNSSQEIKDYMTATGYDLSRTGFRKLWAEFHRKALEIWDEQVVKSGGQSGLPVMLWSSELTQVDKIAKYLDKNRYVIEVWEPLENPLLEKLLRLGYQAISVPKDIWYLDHGFWGMTKFSNWRRMYDHKISRDNFPNLLGGEVAMWTELVDEQGMDTRIWPRAAAVAERLWSNPTTGPNDAEPRLQSLRGRLITRGLKPDAMSPEWCSQHAARCL